MLEDMSAPMPGEGRRARHRREVDDRILAAARKHLASEGAAGLSLRAVARDVGLASSAVYRYVDSRDELLTRLIETAYGDLADAVDDAVDAAPDEGLEQGFQTIAAQFRRWALEHPHDYALVYGSPVPGFTAAPERTLRPGTRVIARLLHRRSRSSRGGFRTSYPADALAGARRWLAEDPQLRDVDLGPDALLDLLDAWTLLVGSVSREVFGQLGETAEAEALFSSAMQLAARIYAGA